MPVVNDQFEPPKVLDEWLELLHDADQGDGPPQDLLLEFEKWRQGNAGKLRDWIVFERKVHALQE